MGMGMGTGLDEDGEDDDGDVTPSSPANNKFVEELLFDTEEDKELMDEFVSSSSSDSPS